MTSDPRATNAAAPAPGGGVRLKPIVLPTEHGSWSFLGEPVLLGLLVAPSRAGALIALAALAAFLARQPLKLMVADLRRGKSYPRTKVAQVAFAVLAVVAALAMVGALMMGGRQPLFALACAAPLAALAIAFDIGRKSREAAGELAGALALGAVATAIALAGGTAAPRAFALWAVLAARAVPTILYVRARLRLEKGQDAGIAIALGWHVAAIGAALLLVRGHVAPVAVVWAMVVLLARAALMLSPARPRLATWQLGVVEVAMGTLVVLCAALR